MLIRPETPGDHEAIRGVIAEAFGTAQEATLVDDLRRDGDLAVALVAEAGGAICGHIALSWLKSPPRALALAPVAVSKAAQHQGIGAALIRHAIDAARGLGADIVFVLGEPGYYGRFGFAQGVAARFPSRYTGPYFMALPLTDAPADAGPVAYARAFDKLQ